MMDMKKLFSILFLVCVVSTFVIAEKTVIRSKALAVAPFDVIGNAVAADEAEAITELYRTALINEAIKIVERENFDKILTEFNFQVSDWSNSEKMAKLGKAINANFILRGKIMKLGSRFRITITVIDINTAELLITYTLTYDTIDDIANNIHKAADSLIHNFTYCNVFDKGEAGGSIFLVRSTDTGHDFYEAVFLTDETMYFSEAKELASNYSGSGYADWRLPTEEDAKDIFNNIIKLNRCSSDAIKKSYFVIRDNGSAGYVSFNTFKGSSKPYFHYFDFWQSNDFYVCLVRKFTGE